MFKKPPGQWKCDACYVWNDKEATACVSCAVWKSTSELAEIEFGFDID